jgi:hypothetical protein
MNLFLYYRISDKGNPKEKLPNADKFSCLLNAIDEFGLEYFHIIADNCSQQTVEFIKANGISYEETSLGNSLSFIYMMDKIIQEHKPDDFVYLLEDDYIHLPGSKNILLEGLGIADYVSLYDHPDKYYLESSNGSPFNYKKIHSTCIYITKNSHWRETDSTTMTFACTVKTLQEDYSIWKKYCSIAKTPKDFLAFITITQHIFSDAILFLNNFKRHKGEFKIIFKNWFLRRKTKKLITALPAYATHTEIKYLSPVVKW